MRAFQIFCLLLLIKTSYAQNNNQDLYSASLVKTGGRESINAITDSLASMLPNKLIYLQNETHNVSIGSFMKFSLYQSFNKYKGVNYMLQESGHSIQFARNLFFKYGDVTILLDFDGLLNDDKLDPSQYYKNTIQLYNTNKLLSDREKIRFIGIDFEMDDVRGLDPGRRETYFKALKYFKKYAENPIPTELDRIFDRILADQKMSLKSLQKQNELIKNFSQKNIDLVKATFGEFYFDFNLIINSSNTFPKDRRDNSMFENFKRAYQLIKEKYPDDHPKFFGIFGSTHIKPGQNGSLASIFNHSEIFNNQVSLIGQSYINCKTSYFKDKKPSVPIENSGLYYTDRAKNEESKLQLRFISDELKSPIILLGNFKKLQLNSKYGFTKYYDAVFIYTGF